MIVHVCTCLPLHRALTLGWQRAALAESGGPALARRVPWGQRAGEGSQEMLPTVTALGLP